MSAIRRMLFRVVRPLQSRKVRVALATVLVLGCDDEVDPVSVPVDLPAPPELTAEPTAEPTATATATATAR